MRWRRTATRRPATDHAWSRRRLQVLLALAVMVVAALVGGCVWSIMAMWDDQSAERAVGGAAVAAPATVDQDGGVIGPRGELGLRGAQPGPLSTGTTGTIVLPPPVRMGPVQVPTGFPRTREGALAQLIALDRRALESTSVVTAQDVIANWARPGGPTPQGWSGVRAVAVLLSAADLPAAGSTDLEVALHPAMGLIRTAEEKDVVVACVDFVATIGPLAASLGGTRGSAAGPVRVAVADCQRMVWGDARWMIAPGAEPPSSPSTWPGSQGSYDAGYQWLTVSP